MIARLTGKLTEKSPGHCIIDVGGIGYEVCISLSTFSSLPEIDTLITLEIYTHVREDQLVLFGFADQPEKKLFKKLISISGVGPKMALGILSGLPVRDLVCAIGSGDSARISTIPGIGKKTSERIIVELKEKIARDIDITGMDKAHPTTTINEDAISALTNLGYKQAIAESALRKIGSMDDMRIEEIIRSALRELNRV